MNRPIRLAFWSGTAAALLACGIAPRAAAAQPPEIYAKTRDLRMPIQMDEAVRRNIAQVKLYTREPDGDWQCVATVAGADRTIDYTAPADGTYSFLYVLVDLNGKNFPASLADARPQRTVVVDTVKPDIDLKLIRAANGNVLLQAAMIDANPDPRGISLEAHAEDGSWKAMVPISAESPGLFRVDDSLPRGQLRATLRDRAGNAAVLEVGFPGEPVSNTSSAITISNTMPALDRMADLSANNTPVKPAFEPKPVPAPGATAGFETRDVKQPQWPKPLPVPAAMPETPLTSEMTGPSLQAPAEPRSAPPELRTPAKLPAAIAEEPLMLPELPRITPVSAMVPSRPAAERDIPVVRIETRSCELDYDPADPAAKNTDYWLTRDGGQHWEWLSNEAPAGRKLRFILPGEGLYGIRIRPRGSDQPPATGERPDCRIEVKFPAANGPSLKMPER